MFFDSINILFAIILAVPLILLFYYLETSGIMPLFREINLNTGCFGVIFYSITGYIFASLLTGYMVKICTTAIGGKVRNTEYALKKIFPIYVATAPFVGLGMDRCYISNVLDAIGVPVWLVVVAYVALFTMLLVYYGL